MNTSKHETFVKALEQQTKSFIGEEIFANKADAIERAKQRSKRTNKTVYLVQNKEGFVLHTHGIMRQGDTLLNTYKNDFGKIKILT